MIKKQSSFPLQLTGKTKYIYMTHIVLKACFVIRVQGYKPIKRNIQTHTDACDRVIITGFFSTERPG